MGFYPFNRKLARTQQADAPGVAVGRGSVAHYHVAGAAAPAASTNGVHAAVQDNGSQRTVTTGITSPAVPRNITATAGGTAADIKAVQVTVHGTNAAGQAISETLPAFTVDTAGTVQGTKAFATVTRIVIPAHDGTGATTAIGFGNKLGLPDRLAHSTVLAAYLNNVKEGTGPTVTVNAAAVEGNTVTLNSALNGTAVDVYYLV